MTVMLTMITPRAGGIPEVWKTCFGCLRNNNECQKMREIDQSHQNFEIYQAQVISLTINCLEFKKKE